MPKSAITEINCGQQSWVDVAGSSPSELKVLRERFNFHELDVRDCAPPLQRAKFVARPEYLFIILIYPIYDARTRSVEVRELDLFIGKNFFVTVHNDSLPPLGALIASLTKSTKGRTVANTRICSELLYQMLDELLDSCFPMLASLGNQIESVEKKMENIHDRKTIAEIFRIKTSIVNFRKAIHPHKSVLRKMIARLPEFMGTDRFTHYFNHLVDHTKEIWDQLEIESETIEAIEDTHLSLLNFRTNDIMRALTVFAVIVFPLTMIAAIFGMNAKNIPIIGHPLDFWLILLLMLLGALLMLWFFRRKKWL